MDDPRGGFLFVVEFTVIDTMQIGKIPLRGADVSLGSEPISQKDAEIWTFSHYYRA